MDINSLPFEILLAIFEHLDIVSLIRGRSVCKHWKQAFKLIKDNTWQRRCHSEIEAHILKQLLLSSSPAMTNITWKQLYISWYTSIHNPNCWEFINRYSLTVSSNEFIPLFKICGDYIITFQMAHHNHCLSLNSLKDCVFLDSHPIDGLGIEFHPIILNNTLYVYYFYRGHHFNNAITILRIHNNKFEVCNQLKGGKLAALSPNTSIRNLIAYNDYILIDTCKKINIFKMCIDPRSPNTVNFKTIGKLGHICQCKQYFWGEKLLLITQMEIVVYSMAADDLSQVAKIKVPVNFHFLTDLAYAIVNENLFLAFDENYLIEIKYTNGQYKVEVEHNLPAVYQDSACYCGKFCGLQLLREKGGKHRILNIAPPVKDFFKENVQHFLTPLAYNLEGYFKGQEFYLARMVLNVMYIEVYRNTLLGLRNYSKRPSEYRSNRPKRSCTLSYQR